MTDNDNKRRLKLGSILRILFVVLLLIAVISVIYTSIFTLKRITDSEIERESALLENSVNLWDKKIQYDLAYMYDYMDSNENVIKVLRAQSDSDMFYALKQIQSELYKYAMLHYGMEEIFFYASSAKNNGFVASYTKVNTVSTTIKQEMALEFIRLGEADDSIGKWAIREMDGINYLVFILKRNDSYLGCWSSIDYMLEDFVQGSNVPQGNHIVFITDEGGVSKTKSYLNGTQIDLDAEEGHNQESNEEYRQIRQRSSYVPIYFVEHINKGVIESAVSRVRSTLILIGVVLVASIALWLGILDYMLFRPMRTLVAHMKQLSAGDLNTRISENSRLQEISLQYDTFNNMADELQNLKIAVYEHELQVQKSELEYMQMQIHPHFLVNGINSVSAMIDMNRLDAAREMCAYLAEYYRYQFQQTAGMIPLQDEMKQVELYLSIQKMRHPGKMDYTSEVDEECLLVPVPPLSIVTFAGNAFKYGMNRTTFRTDISIRVNKTEGGTHIEIRDKGPGFTDEVLQLIDRHEPIYEKGRECIGIRNAMVRLHLFYDGKATFRAYNDDGAVVEIEIPVQS